MVIWFGLVYMADNSVDDFIYSLMLSCRFWIGLFCLLFGLGLVVIADLGVFWRFACFGG